MKNMVQLVYHSYPTAQMACKLLQQLFFPFPKRKFIIATTDPKYQYIRYLAAVGALIPVDKDLTIFKMASPLGTFLLLSLYKT